MTATKTKTPGKKTAPAATKASSKKTSPAAPAKKMSALDAAHEVLTREAKSLNAKELIAAMTGYGLWTSPGGKTPHATLYAAILREIGVKGDASHFRKVSAGQFAAAGSAKASPAAKAKSAKVRAKPAPTKPAIAAGTPSL